MNAPAPRRAARAAARLAALALAPAVLAAPAGTRPNILFCIADDASWPHMGAYGCPWVKTPGFDRVAREGLLFTRAYTPDAKCAPSRSCILTGRNPWQLEAAANHVPYFPEKFTSLFEALERHGYFVGHTLKGWGPGNQGQRDGRRRELVGPAFNARTLTPPAEHISNNDYAANFADFLAARPKDKPFCFWYGSIEPHRAYEYGAGVRLGGRKPSDVDRVPAVWPDNETVRTDLLDYAFELEWFDRHARLMLEELEKRGELDNTLVIVTADNGMPFPRSKGQCYDVSNHMPLAIRWPKGIAKPGRTIDDFVSFIDFAPTCLEAAGLAAVASGMAPMAGRSLGEIFRAARGGRVIAARDHALIGRERHDVGRPRDEGYPVRGIVTESHLYLRNVEPARWPACNPETGYLDVDGSPTKTLCIQARTNPARRAHWQLAFGFRPAEELYDLARDRDCVKNLAADPAAADTRKTLAARLLADLKAQGDPRASGGDGGFDAYPYAGAAQRNFHARFTKGEKLEAGWVNPTDFDPAAAAEEKPPAPP